MLFKIDEGVTDLKEQLSETSTELKAHLSKTSTKVEEVQDDVEGIRKSVRIPGLGIDIYIGVLVNMYKHLRRHVCVEMTMYIHYLRPSPHGLVLQHRSRFVNLQLVQIRYTTYC